jgi:hypothetical protein
MVDQTSFIVENQFITKDSPQSDDLNQNSLQNGKRWLLNGLIKLQKMLFFRLYKLKSSISLIDLGFKSFVKGLFRCSLLVHI